jgi:drug/metabolite transporter (DMT)-like permease
MHPDVVIPLAAGFVYAIAALLLKRATDSGAGPWRTAFVTNWVSALVFSFWALQGGSPFAWIHLGHAMLAGCFFFLGQILAFLALSRGDVSVATPVLGTKVIFVVLFSRLLTSAPVPSAWWFAALLTALGTALLGGSGARRGPPGISMLLGFAAAACFSMSDVLCQKWAPALGVGHFVPVMFWTVALLSLALVPLFREPLRALSASTFRWLLAGALVVSVQASGVVYSIVAFGSAARTNVLYNTRGVWSVVLVWGIGHWFGNVERELGNTALVRRLAGAILLLSAIVLVVT